jgi:hypothetical protein
LSKPQPHATPRRTSRPAPRRSTVPRTS